METIKEKEYTLSLEQFIANKQTWSDYCAAKVQGQAWAHLLVTLMLGHDPFEAFKPLTNAGHLEAHSNDPWASLKRASYDLHYKLVSAKTNIEKPELYTKWGEKYKPGTLFLSQCGKLMYAFAVTLEFLAEIEARNDKIAEGIKARA